MALKEELSINYAHFAENKDSVAILTLHKSRKIRHCCTAEFFTEAFKKYEEAYPDELLDLKALNSACNTFIDMYSVKHKDDFAYLIRHPELTTEPDYLAKKNALRMKFDCSDENQKEAFEYLKNLAPKHRILPIERITKQFVVREGFEYYTEQLALRMMKNLQDMNKNREEICEESKEMINLIWSIAAQNV